MTIKILFSYVGFPQKMAEMKAYAVIVAWSLPKSLCGRRARAGGRMLQPITSVTLTQI